MPDHLKRICSVIDTLPPDINFEVSPQSEPGESGLPRGLEQEEADSQSSRVSLRDVTPHTSVSEQIEGRVSKKARKRGPPMELHQDRKTN